MRTKFTLHHDPAHAWLEVNLGECLELGIYKKISAYSYKSRLGNILYLEEDCDASLFVKAYKARFGFEPELVESDRGEYNFIRELSKVK